MLPSSPPTGLTRSEQAPCLRRTKQAQAPPPPRLSLSFYPPQFWLAYLRASPSSVATKIGSTSLFPPVRTDRLEAKLETIVDSVGNFFSGKDQLPWCDPDIVAVKIEVATIQGVGILWRGA
ncbi:hypothetical protein HN51_070223 [Arachis hypogaea]